MISRGLEGKMTSCKYVCEYTSEVKRDTTSRAERITGSSAPTLAHWYLRNLGYLLNAYKLPGAKLVTDFAL